MLPSENDTLTSLVSRVMRIEGVTWGDPAKNFVARFQGEFYSEDPAAAYDQLAEALRPL